MEKMPKRAAFCLISCNFHPATQTIAKFKCQKNLIIKKTEAPSIRIVTMTYPSHDCMIPAQKGDAVQYIVNVWGRECPQGTEEFNSVRTTTSQNPTISLAGLTFLEFVFENRHKYRHIHQAGLGIFF